MRSLNRIALAGVLMSLLAGVTMGQESESGTNGASRTMRPVVRGRHFAVASVITIPNRPSANLPRWTKWKSPGMPSRARYCTIGARTVRLGNVIPREVIGVNSSGRAGVAASFIGFPVSCARYVPRSSPIGARLPSRHAIAAH